MVHIKDNEEKKEDEKETGYRHVHYLLYLSPS